MLVKVLVEARWDVITLATDQKVGGSNPSGRAADLTGNGHGCPDGFSLCSLWSPAFRATSHATR